jgi:hypothetical protein
LLRGIPSGGCASAPISVKDQLTLPDPFTALPVEPIVKVLEVPQLDVVISALPLKLVPFIDLAVANLAVVSLNSASYRVVSMDWFTSNEYPFVK